MLILVGLLFSHPNMKFNLNCMMRGGDRNHIFTIKISCTNTVDGLRHAIKIKKGCMFYDVDTNDIPLWNIPLPIDDSLRDNLVRLDSMSYDIIVRSIPHHAQESSLAHYRTVTTLR
jgi:hypothetical protein